MSVWWDNLGLLEQIFFIIATPATLILIVQTIALTFGGGMDAPDSGLDSDISGIGDTGEPVFSEDTGLDVTDSSIHHADDMGLRLFSIRGILAFLTVFGWSGILLLESGVHEVIAVLISAALGSAALYFMALLIRSLMRLQESGNADYRRALGKTARVYLTIPPSGNGQGKINLMLGDSLGEFWAVTNSPVPIPTGTSVRVVDLAGGIYTVEKEQD